MTDSLLSYLYYLPWTQLDVIFRLCMYIQIYSLAWRNRFRCSEFLCPWCCFSLGSNIIKFIQKERKKERKNVRRWKINTTKRRNWGRSQKKRKRWMKNKEMNKWWKEQRTKQGKGDKYLVFFFYGGILKCPLTIESEMRSCARFDGWGWGWRGGAGRGWGRLCCLRKNNLIDT